MLKPNKPRARKRNIEIPELTTGQQIGAIVALLVVGLICFALGILVGNKQPRPYPTPQAMAQEREAGLTAKEPVSPPPSPRGEVRRTAAPLPQEGIQKSPRPVAMNVSKPAKTAVPAAEGGRKPAPAPGRATERPAPPKKAATPVPEPVKAPEPPSTPPASSTGAEEVALAPESPAAGTPPSQSAKPTAPASDTADAAAPGATANTPMSPKTPTAPKAPDAPSRPNEVAAVTSAPVVTAPAPQLAESEAVSPVLAATGGPFVIQLHSFSGPNREQAAQKAQDPLLEAGFPVELIPSADGKYVRVVIGGYPDKKTAEAARKELAARPDIPDDCWVRKR